MQNEITFELDGVGEVVMVGIGPWSLNGRDIRDSNKVIANPTVTQRWSTVSKPNKGVVFAKVSTAQAIVTKANELLAELESAPAASTSETQVDG